MGLVGDNTDHARLLRYIQSLPARWLTHGRPTAWLLPDLARAAGLSPGACRLAIEALEHRGAAQVLLHAGGRYELRPCTPPTERAAATSRS
jgi:hypothetical protein